MPNVEPDIVVRIRDLVVGFGNQIVLDALSLDVRRGEILGLVGASGGGKSVLLRAIIGLIPKRQGHIEVMKIDRDTATPEENSCPRKALGGFIPAGRVVFLAYSRGKHSVPDAGKSSST